MRRSRNNYIIEISFSFLLSKNPFINSNKIPIKGMTKSAPKNPQSVAPITKENKTITGGRSTIFFINIGDKILFSTCWIKTKVVRTKTAFNISVGNIITKSRIAVNRGPI